MKKWIALLLAAMMVFSMAACAAKNEPAADQANDQAAADSDMAYVKEKGTLVVGITDFPLFYMRLPFQEMRQID